MNFDMIKKLVVKDWHLLKLYLLGYIVIGLFSIWLLTVPSKVIFNLGAILLITLVIGVACHLVIWSVVIEKKEYRLSFIMSLPIDAMDYALSKLHGGVILFLFPWSVLFFTTLIVIHHSHLPDGMLPFATIMFLELLAAYTFLTAVAVVTLSEAWTIVVMVGQNMMFSVFMMLVGNHPDIGPHTHGEIAQWTPAVITIVQAELFFIVMVLAVATVVKTRSRYFL